MIPGPRLPRMSCPTSLHYGSGVFEGIRCYQNPRRRRRATSSVCATIWSACIAAAKISDRPAVLGGRTVRRDDRGAYPQEQAAVVLHPSDHVLPRLRRDGVDPTRPPTDVAIAVVAVGHLPGRRCARQRRGRGRVVDALQGTNNSIPPAVKATASYMNSILAKLEAKEHGYVEAIMLNEAGLVCEGTGENLFVVRDGILSTPPLSDGLLEGITRDTVLCLADDLEIPAIEESLTRSDPTSPTRCSRWLRRRAHAHRQRRRPCGGRIRARSLACCRIVSSPCAMATSKSTRNG